MFVMERIRFVLLMVRMSLILFYLFICYKDYLKIVFTDFFLTCYEQANPPQLHSNLKFIQLYRRQAKLVSEAAYYFTNLVSAKTFVVDLSAKSLSMDEIKFEESMQAARLTNKATQIEASPTLQGQTIPIPPTGMQDKNKDISGKPETTSVFFPRF